MSSRLIGALTRVGGGTLASRVLGFVRDVVIARAFGASAGADAFFVAFRIPNLLRRLFAEGAFSQAFVPVLSEYRERRSHEEVRELAREANLTLIGRARGKRFVALAGEDRIVYDADPSAVGDEPRHLQRKASLAEPG